MRLAAIVLLFMVPVQAMALSCQRPSVERSYHTAAKADETYVIVKGRLTFDARKMPREGAGTSNPPKLTRVTGRLVGKSMTATGFNVPFERKVMLEVACIGPWCGGAENGGQVLAFVRRDAAGYVVSVNPCGGFLFANPKPAMTKQVVQCFNGGACKGR